MNFSHKFRQALISEYRENPCQVLPNALWKSLPWGEQFETDYQIEGDKVTHLITWDQQQLMLYWSRARDLRKFPFKDNGSLKFALLHQDFEAALKIEDFDNRYRTFRLLHEMDLLPSPELPAGYSFVTANPNNESQAISNLIDACYEDIHLSPETVQSWCSHPVFDADLWVWITNETHDTPAALGIAEFDPMIAEGSLEWVQVLPDYRRQGLGQQLVYELLRRLKNLAEFVTVAGRVDNVTRPEMLYRRCGFEGDDVWWVLRR